MSSTAIALECELLPIEGTSDPLAICLAAAAQDGDAAFFEHLAAEARAGYGPEG